MPGAGGVSTQTAELAALGAKIILHIGTAGLIGKELPEDKLIISISSYKDGAAVLLSKDLNGRVNKISYPDKRLVKLLIKNNSDTAIEATGYTIPIFYYQPQNLLKKIVLDGSLNCLPKIGYIEMEQSSFFETCQLAKTRCASIVIGSDRTIIENSQIIRNYFKQDIRLRKIDMLKMALEVFRKTEKQKEN